MKIKKFLLGLFVILIIISCLDCGRLGRGYKEMEKGKNNEELKYYTYRDFRLEGMHEIPRAFVNENTVFFRASDFGTIYNNIKEVEEKCVSYTHIKEIPIGKKMKFHLGDPMEFYGTVIGRVKLGKDKYLEIEVKPGRLYVYAWIYKRIVSRLKPIRPVDSSEL